MKLCPKCDQLKLESEFYHSKATADGLQNQCKLCAHLAVRQSRARSRPHEIVLREVSRIMALDPELRGEVLRHVNLRQAGHV